MRARILREIPSPKMRTVRAATWIALSAVGLATLVTESEDGFCKAGARSPVGLGRVFRAHRGSVVRVRVEGREDEPRTGFLIGAEGEVLFGAARSPGPKLTFETSDGRVFSGRLLGYDRSLGLAVGDMDAPGLVLEPLRPVDGVEMGRSGWFLVIQHGRAGEPEPHAGELGPVDSKDDRVPILAPGAPGSPVLSESGALVGVVTRGGSRQCFAMPIERLIPFLKAVVLEQRER